MFLVKELRLFYPDLQSEDYESAIGMVHSRFSTNTAPSWNRAHPNRFIPVSYTHLVTDTPLTSTRLNTFAPMTLPSDSAP